MLRTGDEIGGWVVERTLGEGGMGAVYLCHSPLSEKVRAAVKVLKPHTLDDGRERFIREMEALATLSHPGIVRVLGSGHDAAHDVLFLAMEYLEGETLEVYIDRRLPWEEGAGLVQQVVAALDHAHKAGIRHRDVKPANVIVTPDGTTRLLDFGIAVQAGRTRLTQDQRSVPGTMAYVPPEVFEGLKPSSVSSDVYASGLLLWEIVAGRRAYPDDPTLSAPQRMARIMAAKIQGGLGPLPEGTPDSLSQLVHWATDADPAARLEDMAMFHDALDKILAGHHDTLPALVNNLGETIDPSRTSIAATMDVGAFLDFVGTEEEPPDDDSEELPPIRPEGGGVATRVAMWLVLLVALGGVGAMGAWMMLAPTPDPGGGTSDVGGGGGDDYVDLTEGPGYVVGLYDYELVELPAGDFWMGSRRLEPDHVDDEIRHPVSLSRPVLFGTTEVHQELFEAVMRANPSVTATQRVDGTETGHECKDWGPHTPKSPVTCVSWFDVVNFVNGLSQMEDLTPAYVVTEFGRVNWNREANGYRLPTEAEWEYAALGGENKKYAGVNKKGKLCEVANVTNPATKETEFAWMTWKPLDCDDGFHKLAPVKQLKPNGYGLYDMTGNVREWVWDFYGPYTDEPITDPRGPARGEKKVYRGGSWGDRRKRLRVSARRGALPDTREPTLGFRIVRYADQEE